jgi:2-polyprenyl-3-methyl-5-hydroxy-6-metoxy-1,4-benzoquinol methylase
MSSSSWDEQYSSGRWSYLGTVEQAPRYAIIAAWIDALAPNARILDVGCGEGLLLKWLRTWSRYDGVDISSVALATAARDHRRPGIAFHHCAASDFMGYESSEFDCIVFNEVLYYCSDPIALFSRYQASLAPRGISIVSICDFERETWNRLEFAKAAQMTHVVRLSDVSSRKEWTLAVIRKDSEDDGRSSDTR